MRSLVRFLGVLALSVGFTTIPIRAAGGGAEAFEKLKALVGHWEGAPGSAMKEALDIEVSSGGTAVLERISMVENGKPVTMVTVYYLDGDQLRLTHYCDVGNQPTMAGSYDSATKTLTFNFVSATSLKSPDDGHMHHAVFTFVDNDHLKQQWTYRKDQKDAFTEDVTYVRTR